MRISDWSSDVCSSDLLERAIDNYVKRRQPAGVQETDKLSVEAGKVAADLYAAGKIDKKYLGAITKLKQGEEIVSLDTLNRYVHSPNFSVSPDHLDRKSTRLNSSH